jgi:glutamine cyclotransferase
LKLLNFMKTSLLFLLCFLFAWSSYALAHSQRGKFNFYREHNDKIALQIDPIAVGQMPLEPGPVPVGTNTTDNTTNSTTNDTAAPPANNTNTTNTTSATGPYTVVNTYDRQAPFYYTQGLTFASDNVLLESYGLYGESGIHLLNLDDMSIEQPYRLENNYFAEGSDYILNEAGEKEVYQLTWRERDVMVYNATSLERIRMLRLPEQIKEGWGLTKRFVEVNGVQTQEVLITDGSANVYTCDPETLAVRKTFTIKDDDGNRVKKLNELEIVQGKLWANIYMTNKIAVIDLDTGKFDHYLDFTDLVDTARNNFWQSWTPDYCLNGIAYNPDSNRLILTGKKWTKLFEIQMN